MPLLNEFEMSLLLNSKQNWFYSLPVAITHALQDLNCKRLPSLALHPSLTWTKYLGVLTYIRSAGNTLKENIVAFFLFLLKIAPCNYYYVSLTIFVHIYIYYSIFILSHVN